MDFEIHFIALTLSSIYILVQYFKDSDRSSSQCLSEKTDLVSGTSVDDITFERLSPFLNVVLLSPDG